MGSDGVNPVDFIILEGGGSRMWFEARHFRPHTRISKVRNMVPADPHDPNALIDAVLTFDLGRFTECPSFAAVRDQLEDVDRLDFDRGLNIPAAWPALREEARPIFERIGPGERGRPRLASKAVEVWMIEEMQDMPAGVNGIRISGRVTADDFVQFRPTLDRMMDSDEIRFVEVIGPDYEGFGPGGLLADFKQSFGTLKHIHAFKRTAVVSDKEWVAHTMHALGWMIPGEVAVFGLDELEEAKRWAAG